MLAEADDKSKDKKEKRGTRVNRSARSSSHAYVIS